MHAYKEMAVKQEFKIEGAYNFNRSGPVRWIISHMLRYPFLPVCTLAGAILENLSYSYIQVYVGRAFDLITSPRWTSPELMFLSLMVLFVAVMEGTTGLLRNYATEFLAQRFERDVRDELVLNLLGKSQTFHCRQRIGDIMARAVNDVRSLNLMVNPGLMLIVDSILAAVVPIAVIATLSLELLLVPVLFLILFTITIYDYNRKLNPVSIALRDQFGEMNAGLTESIAGIEIIKANAYERKEWLKFVENAGKNRDLFVRQGEIQAFYLPMLMFHFIRALAFFHALFLWHTDRISLGDAVAFMGLIGALRFTTFISTFSFNLVQLGFAGAGRILQLINTESELDENETGREARINGDVLFNNVSFGYSSGENRACDSESNGPPALERINFSVKAGETVAIVGRTGSGKTTLTRLINRIFDTDCGSVLIDGVDVRDWKLASLRSQVSEIEQDIFLFSRTIAENIAFGCEDADREQIEAAARAAQAHEFIIKFENGYDTVIGERGVTLSGGQRQRIAIARAFLTNPRILILDDSTSAVDSATEDLIQQAMKRISHERTTFLITHRMSQIRWADRILVLKNGWLADQGRHEELIERCRDYQRIFSQYG